MVTDVHTMDIFLIYARLVIYPLLVYSLLIYAWGVLSEKNRELSQLLVLISIVFVLLWGSSIIFYLTRDNILVVDFNSFGLVPYLVFLIAFIWVQIYKYIREQKTTKEKLKEHKHGNNNGL